MKLNPENVRDFLEWASWNHEVTFGKWDTRLGASSFEVLADEEVDALVREYNKESEQE